MTAAVLFGCAAPPAPRAAEDTRGAARSVDPTLSAQLEAIARPHHARIGVAFRVLETGFASALRGDERFPMASVYKLPIALTVLRLAERGQFRLDEPQSISATDLSVDYSPIAVGFPASGRAMTISDLLAAMIVDSDNTASDVLLRKVGGPDAVMATLAGLGVSGIRVDRSELAIDADSLNAARPGALEQPGRAAQATLEQSLTPPEEEAMERAYTSDPRDTATPNGIIVLLARFQLGRAASPESTELLRSLLVRAHPRMALRLPPGVIVAHKTGTGWGSSNDVGIVTLPSGRHLLLAIFVSQAQSLSFEAGDWLVADAARAVFDYASAH